MNITYYKVKDENNVINKNIKDVVGTASQHFKIKKPTNYMNIELRMINAPGLDEANYCYIDGKINRYFYIMDRIFEGGNMVTLILKCDVLMSYKDDILNSVTFIERSETGGNPYLDDTIYPLSTKRKVLFNSLGHFDRTLYNYLVVTGGSST